MHGLNQASRHNIDDEHITIVQLGIHASVDGFGKWIYAATAAIHSDSIHPSLSDIGFQIRQYPWLAV
jgi:hypothetical protein